MAESMAGLKQAIEARDRELDEQRAEIERQRAEGERAARDAEGRVAAAVGERDVLARELEAARHGMNASQADTAKRLTTLETERAALDRTRHELRSQLDIAIRDRELVIAELETTRETAAAAQAEAQHKYEQLRETAAERVRQLEMEQLRRGDQLGDRDVELAELVGAGPTEDAVGVIEIAEQIETVHARMGQAPPPAPAAAIAPPEAAVPPAAEPAEKAAHAPAKSRAKTPATPPAPPADQPVRRASRQAFRHEVAIQIDGSEGVLVDLSVTGAQLLSTTALKPNRVVKLLLPLEQGGVPCKGKIVWARLEPPSRGAAFKYRAGVFFTAVDERAVEAFIARHVSQ